MKKIPILIFLFIFVAFSAISAYGAPTSGVSTTSAAVPAPLTQTLSSNGTQIKHGSISVTKMLVGDLGASSPTVAVLTSDGKLGLGFSGSNPLDPTEALDVHGAIDILGTADNGTNICADSSGALAPCGSIQFPFDGKDCSYGSNGILYTCGSANMNAAYITKEFKVPVGVTSLTVELVGAGGAGYGINNSTYNNSPDSDINYSGTCSSGSYSCIIGGSTYLLASNGSTILLRAKGGYGATSSHAGASGGSFTISSGNGITDTGSASGGSGGNGDAAAGTPTTQTVTCNSTNYSARIPVSGGDGGLGGKSGNGTDTPGGKGGHKGSDLTTLNSADLCNNVNTPENGKGYLGENGISGAYGNGGSGAGGKGGKADQNINTLCGGSCTAADQGYAGGGGGGYAKATIPVTPGTYYKIKISHGGNVQSTSEVTSYTLNFFKSVPTLGALSGNGGSGFAKITY